MSTSRKQQKFLRAQLILGQYAIYLGYQLTYGDAYRAPLVPYGHPQSTHRSRLAVDYNIFLDEGNVYLGGKDAEAAFDRLHDLWDMLGGSKRIPNDLRHFSFEHKGIR